MKCNENWEKMIILESPKTMVKDQIRDDTPKKERSKFGPSLHRLSIMGPHVSENSVRSHGSSGRTSPVQSLLEHYRRGRSKFWGIEPGGKKEGGSRSSFQSAPPPLRRFPPARGSIRGSSPARGGGCLVPAPPRGFGSSG
jgi:hypothetical protein